MFFRIARLVGAVLMLSTVVRAQSAATTDLTPNSELTLISESTALRPGTTTTLALRITMDPGWHTYWTNPGDAGLPLGAQWKLPKGVTVSSLRYPAPRLIPQTPLMSFGYEREVLVLADVSVSNDVPIGTPITIAADVDFLVCADVCLPASGHVEWQTRASSVSAQSRDAAAIASTRERLVKDGSTWNASGWRDGARVVLRVPMPPSGHDSVRSAYFIADSADVLQHAVVQRFVMIGDTLVASVTPTNAFADAVSHVSLVLLTDATNPKEAIRLDVSLGQAPRDAKKLAGLIDGPRGTNSGGVAAMATVAAATTASAQGGAVAAANTPASTRAPASDIGLLVAVLLAFVGGMVLNLMPCVFPVLSVKILGFVERGGDTDQGAAGRKHAMVFTLGVLVMMWALAGTLFALRAGGAQLGWGFQLQSPAVVAVLALVVFALALNLSGVFEMGMSLTRLGGVGGGSQYRDSFLTGLLAVVVATPCTAPFMGAALGYALTQSAATGLAVFTSLGIGLATPYVVLATNPALLRLLPRPGPWLETFKQLLAFPLYATVVWLLWVLGRQSGPDTIAIALLFAVALSMTAWFAGRAQHAGHARRSSVGLSLLILTIVVSGAAIGAQPTATQIARETPAGWEKWSAARVAAARDSGRAVFVDFTAAWCLSCQVNERVALHTEQVERAFADANVLLLRADWTSRDAEITAVLTTFGRSGVPLYVVYPSSKEKQEEILPAVLTPGSVIDAIARATTKRVAIAE